MKNRTIKVNITELKHLLRDGCFYDDSKETLNLQKNILQN
jgi:hypothetical protein